MIKVGRHDVAAIPAKGLGPCKASRKTDASKVVERLDSMAIETQNLQVGKLVNFDEAPRNNVINVKVCDGLGASIAMRHIIATFHQRPNHVSWNCSSHL